jgi:hypothetical protein
MLEKSDIAHLIRKHSLMQGEVDSRHIELLNDIYALGINLGVNQAKESIVWRINGPLWVKFIEENICHP